MIGGRVLVAGIGNVFLGDDGFGVEVVARVDPSRLPERVDVADFGIRGVHLAFELLDGRHDALVLVDALPIGDVPGTLAVLEVDPGAGNVPGAGAPGVDAHAMGPTAMLEVLRGLGGTVGRVLVVGCQPAALDPGIGLSGPVAAAVDEAVRVVERVARDEARRMDGARDGARRIDGARDGARRMDGAGAEAQRMDGAGAEPARAG